MKQPEGLTMTVLTARSGCCLLFVPSNHSPLDFKKRRRSHDHLFALLNCIQFRSAQGKFAVALWAAVYLTFFWFGRFLSTFSVVASRQTDQERRTLATQHRGAKTGTFWNADFWNPRCEKFCLLHTSFGTCDPRTSLCLSLNRNMSVPWHIRGSTPHFSLFASKES